MSDATHQDHEQPFDFDTAASVAAAATRLVGIELDYYERMLETDVGAERVLLGAGTATGMLPGAPQDRFNGVAIFNPSACGVWWMPTTGAAAGAGAYLVPPFSWLALPTRYADCSVAISSVDALGPQIAVSVLRLRVPPHGVAAGPFGGQPIGDTMSAAGQRYNPRGGQVIAALVLPAGIYDARATVTVTNGSETFDARLDGVVVGSGFGAYGSSPGLRLSRLTVPTSATFNVATQADVTGNYSVFAQLEATRVA